MAMKCPICGSKKTIDEEYGQADMDMVERRWACDDCDSTWWQRGYLDDDGWVDYWSKKAVNIEPSEMGEVILAERDEQKRLIAAQERTIPMFE